MTARRSSAASLSTFPRALTSRISLPSEPTQANTGRFSTDASLAGRGTLARIQAHAAAKGESTNAFIYRAINETIQREGETGQNPD